MGLDDASRLVVGRASPPKGWSLLAERRRRASSAPVAARERDEPVMATASQVSAWLLVEVNGPWGRDAIVDSELGPHAPRSGGRR